MGAGGRITQRPLNKYFCTIFVFDYNLISYTNIDYIRTHAVSLQMESCIQ